MKKLLNALNAYFNFTKGESHAVLLLLFIMLLLLAIPHFFNRDEMVYKGDFTRLYQLADSLKKTEEYDVKQSVFDREKPQTSSKFIGRNFNPNTVSQETLMEMGLPRKLALRIVNYRSKVAPFLCKSDLKKVYGIDEPLFIQLSGFIQLPVECQQKIATMPGLNQKKLPLFSSIDLNSADTNSLIALPGIGAKLAQRIVKYRDKLGGFVDLEQLKEVWGLKEEVLQLNQRNWLVKPNSVQLIDVNSCDVDQLGKHPYCDFKMAKLIVAYRQQHGRFNSFDELLNLIGLDIEKLQRLKPYLQF